MIKSIRQFWNPRVSRVYVQLNLSNVGTGLSFQNPQTVPTAQARERTLEQCVKMEESASYIVFLSPFHGKCYTLWYNKSAGERQFWATWVCEGAESLMRICRVSIKISHAVSCSRSLARLIIRYPCLQYKSVLGHEHGGVYLGCARSHSLRLIRTLDLAGGATANEDYSVAFRGIYNPVYTCARGALWGFGAQSLKG